jgi:general secretion pathway protein D
VLLSGDKTDRIRLRALISHIDIPLELGVGDTHVIYLKYAKASELVGVLTGLTQSLTRSTTTGKSAAGGKVDTTLSGNIQIQADDSNNALVINAPPGIIRSIRSVVKRLDIRRAQVMVEAVIAEVSYDKAAELGVQWAFDGSEGGTKNGPVGVSNFSGFGSPITGLLEDPPQIADGLTLGLGRFTDGALSLAVMVRALAGDADTNILSTPTLVTMDNEEARIVVGQNVPFITGQYTNTGGGTTPTNPFQTIERQDIGVTLKITPQINEGDTVFMEIEQTIESLAASTVGADLITNKREITTRVLVDDDQMLVLGGLIEDALRESEQKVPGLGDIPALGWLFKYKKLEKVKTNLMVFIKPTILHNNIDASEHTAQKYKFMRDKQVAIREKGVDFFKDNEAPILPGMEPIPALPPAYQQPGISAIEAPPAALEASQP